jgi:NAD(P)-dependent dehydrogenase (short-subunit alcohol dehydrogenase family)
VALELGLLDGRSAIITGGGTGIGAACARLFAEHGARVTIVDVNADAAESVVAEIRGRAGKARAVVADVRSFDQVHEVVQGTLSAFGAIHILVNNAGVIRQTAFEDISEAEWDLLLDVNLKGAFNCCRAVVPLLKEQRYGKIVNVASMAGRSVSGLGGAHYTASKAGVLGLTRHLARELGPFGINVNAACPGMTETSMQLAVRTHDELGVRAQGLPLRRPANPVEQARVILFLASDWASYMCGASVDVNGGALMI